MPGLIAYSVTGLSFLFLAVLESTPPSKLPSPLHLRYITTLLLAFLSLISSLISLLPSHPHDSLSLPISLPAISVSALVLLYSISGLASVSPSKLTPSFPPSLLDLLAAFAFLTELLLFALHRTYPDGIESRYYALLTIPISVCLLSTLLTIKSNRLRSAPRLARAAGLALQGTWFIQMGFSFFTNAMAHGCALHSRSRADYTIKCRTHEEYHRARSIAVLQFNCHLALMLVVGCVVYAVAVNSRRMGKNGYRMLGKELQMEGVVGSRFTLDSDEEREHEQEEESGKGVNGDALELHVPDVPDADGVEEDVK